MPFSSIAGGKQRCSSFDGLDKLVANANIGA